MRSALLLLACGTAHGWLFKGNFTPEPNCRTSELLNEVTEAHQRADVFYHHCSLASSALCLMDRTCHGLYSTARGCYKMSCAGMAKMTYAEDDRRLSMSDYDHVMLPLPRLAMQHRAGLKPNIACSRAAGRSPRVAICFAGLNRNLALTISSIQRHIFQPLRRACVSYDVYLHTYNMSTISSVRNGERSAGLGTWRQMLDLLRPLKYRVTDQGEFLASISDSDWRSFTLHGKETSFGTSTGPELGVGPLKNALCFWNSLREVTRMWRQMHSHEYRAVIYARPDLTYLDDIDVEQLLRAQPRELYAPFWHTFWGQNRGLPGMNDRFAFGVPSAMAVYGDRIGRALEFSRAHVLQSESFTYWAVQQAGIKSLSTGMRAQRTRAGGHIQAADRCLLWCEDEASRCGRGCYHLLPGGTRPRGKCTFVLLTRTSDRPSHLARLISEVRLAAQRPHQCKLEHIIGADNNNSFTYARALVAASAARDKRADRQHRRLDLRLDVHVVRLVGGVQLGGNRSRAPYFFNGHINELKQFARTRLRRPGRPMHYTVLDDDSSIYEHFFELATAGLSVRGTILTMWRCDYGDYRLERKIPSIANLGRLRHSQQTDTSKLFRDVDSLCYALRDDYHPQWRLQREGDYRALTEVLELVPLANRTVLNSTLCEVNPFGWTAGAKIDLSGGDQCHACHSLWHSLPPLRGEDTKEETATHPLRPYPRRLPPFHYVVSFCSGSLAHIAQGPRAQKTFIYTKCGVTTMVGAPPRSVVKPLPNVGRCDHTYLYHIMKNYRHLPPLLVFVKDTDSIHQAAMARPAREFMHSALRSGFACGQWPDEWYSIWHESAALLRLSKSDYNSTWTQARYGPLGAGGSRRSTFKSRSQNFGVWVQRLEAELEWLNVHRRSLTTARLWPVCYGAVFAATRAAISNVPYEVWHALESKLKRGDNIEESHFMERLWAVLLSPRLSGREEEELSCSSTALQIYAHGMLGTLQQCDCTQSCAAAGWQ